MAAQPDAEFHVLPGVGHWAMYEAPSETNQRYPCELSHLVYCVIQPDPLPARDQSSSLFTDLEALITPSLKYSSWLISIFRKS